MSGSAEASIVATPATRRPIDAWAVGAGLLLFTACALIAREGTVPAAERRVFEAFNGLPDALEPLAHAAQFLGVLAIGPLVALTALALRRYRLALAAALITITKLGAERIVWKVIERERPGVTEPDAVVRADTPMTGWSFVSGHVVLVCALAWAITPYLRGRWRVVPWLVVLLVGSARVYLGAHNPLDVVGGIGLGLAIGGAVNLAVAVAEPDGGPGA